MASWKCSTISTHLSTPCHLLQCTLHGCNHLCSIETDDVDATFRGATMFIPILVMSVAFSLFSKWHKFTSNWGRKKHLKTTPSFGSNVLSDFPTHWQEACHLWQLLKFHRIHPHALPLHSNSIGLGRHSDGFRRDAREGSLYVQYKHHVSFNFHLPKNGFTVHSFYIFHIDWLWLIIDHHWSFSFWISIPKRLALDSTLMLVPFHYLSTIICHLD